MVNTQNTALSIICKPHHQYFNVSHFHNFHFLIQWNENFIFTCLYTVLPIASVTMSNQMAFRKYLWELEFLLILNLNLTNFCTYMLTFWSTWSSLFPYTLSNNLYKFSLLWSLLTSWLLKYSFSNYGIFMKIHINEYLCFHTSPLPFMCSNKSTEWSTMTH